jgi:hemolysin activation/secretion protein
MQSLGAQNTLYLAGLYQWADGNLDSSQKMSAGGPYSVRAYDVGAISGDSGYLATAELRHEIGTAWGGQWQAIAFVDTAKVKINRSTWVAGTNTGTLSGFGVGLNWLGPHGWHARTYIATRLGASPPAVASGEHTRAWIQIGKGY